MAQPVVSLDLVKCCIVLTSSINMFFFVFVFLIHVPTRVHLYVPYGL